MADQAAMDHHADEICPIKMCQALIKEKGETFGDVRQRTPGGNGDLLENDSPISKINSFIKTECGPQDDEEALYINIRRNLPTSSSHGDPDIPTKVSPRKNGTEEEPISPRSWVDLDKKLVRPRSKNSRNHVQTNLADNNLHPCDPEMKQESEWRDEFEDNNLTTSTEEEANHKESKKKRKDLKRKSLPEHFLSEPPKKRRQTRKDSDSNLPSTSKRATTCENKQSSAFTSSDDNLESESELDRRRPGQASRCSEDDCTTKAPYLTSEAAFRKKVIDLQCETLRYLVELKNLISEQRSEVLPPLPASLQLATTPAGVLVEPLSSLEEFKELERRLADEETKLKLIEQCQRIGGIDFKDMVKNVMKRVMKKSLMIHLNMSGQRSKESGKHPFKNSLLCSCIADAVLLRFNKTSQIDITRHIQFILKYCKRYKDWS